MGGSTDEYDGQWVNTRENGLRNFWRLLDVFYLVRAIFGGRISLAMWVGRRLFWYFLSRRGRY